MPAATSDRNTRNRTGDLRSLPLAAATRIWAGTIACINASGLLVSGATATTLKAVGVPTVTLDNSAGAASAISGDVARGVWGPFDNSAAGDQITLADIEGTAWIVDNQTVAKTNGSGTRSAAGKIFAVSAEGVWIDFG